MAGLETALNLLQTGHYEDLAETLDKAELESPNPAVLENWPHALHILAHVYRNNLCDARFLWKRLPDSVKQNNPELDAAWKLVQFYWNRHYPGIWQALAGFQWSPQLQPIVEALVARIREQVLQLVSTAYSSVSVQKAAALCGLPEQDALQVFVQRGWQFDEASGFLTWVHRPGPTRDADNVANLKNLTEYMLHLEQ